MSCAAPPAISAKLAQALVNPRQGGAGALQAFQGEIEGLAVMGCQ